MRLNLSIHGLHVVIEGETSRIKIPFSSTPDGYRRRVTPKNGGLSREDLYMGRPIAPHISGLDEDQLSNKTAVVSNDDTEIETTKLSRENLLAFGGCHQLEDLESLSDDTDDTEDECCSNTSLENCCSTTSQLTTISLKKQALIEASLAYSNESGSPPSSSSAEAQGPTDDRCPICSGRYSENLARIQTECCSRSLCELCRDDELGTPEKCCGCEREQPSAISVQSAADSEAEKYLVHFATAPESYPSKHEPEERIDVSHD